MKTSQTYFDYSLAMLFLTFTVAILAQVWVIFFEKNTLKRWWSATELSIRTSKLTTRSRRSARISWAKTGHPNPPTFTTNFRPYTLFAVLFRLQYYFLMTFRHQFFKIHKQKWRKSYQLDRCKKNKNIEFFGFSKMPFFRSAQPIWGPGKSTNKTKKKWLGSRFFRNGSNHEPNSKANRTSKKTGHKEPKQAKQRTKQVRTTMQRERRESTTSKATNKQARTTQNNEN